MTIAVPRLAGLTLTRREPSTPVALSPRANLLPPSVIAARKARKTLRGIVVAVVAALAVVALGVGAASIVAASSGAALAAEQSRTDSLLAQQAEYSKVSSALTSIQQLTTQEAVAGATDVEWAEYVGLIRSGLPAGVSLAAVSVEATSPLSAIAQPTAPLQGARVAALTLTVDTADLGALQTWLDGLTALPGYVDATPQSISSSSAGGLTATVVLNIGDGAYSGRFAATEEVAK